jgi:hypothetical protein
MFDILVFDHRLGENRQLDSKSELTRLLFGYTTGNGQKFPAQAEYVTFVERPYGGDVVAQSTPLTGAEAIRLVEALHQRVRFTYRAEGRRVEGELAWTRAGLRVR